MKILIVCLLALTFTMSVTSFAQQDTTAPASDKAAAAPLMTLKGTVRAEGDKVTFVRDKDGKQIEERSVSIGGQPADALCG